MQDAPRGPADHPDRLRWNAKYESGPRRPFAPHELATRALAAPPPDGPVLDLACGPSGSALLAAGAGRPVTAVDISEVALDLLGREARRRGLDELITLVHADLGEWRPPPERYALVLCTGYWDRALFDAATLAVAPGGLLAWEAFTADARRTRPHLPAAWCLDAGEPVSRLPADFTVLHRHDPPGPKRGLLSVRRC